MQAAGQARGIDPGRPGVPVFGGRIYHLRHSLPAPHRALGLTKLESVAIYRKVAPRIPAELTGEELARWRKAYRAFVGSLQRSKFHSVVFDYDGTLCDARDRFAGMRDEVGKHLRRLLLDGLNIGVATGRGKSVREDLIKHIPSSLFSRVLIGYYNGAYIHPLTDELSEEEAGEILCDDLLEILKDAPD